MPMETREKRLTPLLWKSLEKPDNTNQTVDEKKLIWLPVEAASVRSVSGGGNAHTAHRCTVSDMKTHVGGDKVVLCFWLPPFPEAYSDPHTHTHCLTLSSCAQKPHQAAALMKAEVRGSP